MLEEDQKKAAKMIRLLEWLMYEDWLQVLNMHRND